LDISRILLDISRTCLEINMALLDTSKVYLGISRARYNNRTLLVISESVDILSSLLDISRAQLHSNRTLLDISDSVDISSTLLDICPEIQQTVQQYSTIVQQAAGTLWTSQSKELGRGPSGIVQGVSLSLAAVQRSSTNDNNSY
jgi:hypothetical protein